jgi:hypothetical protein
MPIIPATLEAEIGKCLPSKLKALNSIQILYCPPHPKKKRSSVIVLNRMMPTGVEAVSGQEEDRYCPAA